MELFYKSLVECTEYGISAGFHKKYNSLPPSTGHLWKVTFLQDGE